ncbi:hypothetical protein GOV05_01910 [Candidatus Woesearchaeota archaeon]|nr:hypothetical protein [Candidatus Woesearchaeota archaeon]
MIFKYKRGVSPIIAAVLLVVITIAIGATTMAFIRSLSDQNLATAEEKSTRIRCGTDISLDVLAIGNAYKICKFDDPPNGGYIELTLQNIGSTTIKGFRLIVLGNGTDEFTTSENKTMNFQVNELKKINMSYTDPGGNLGDAQEYKLEPIIQGTPGQDVYCSDSALSYLSEALYDC